MKIAILTVGSRGDVQPYMTPGERLRAEHGVGIVVSVVEESVRGQV